MLDLAAVDNEMLDDRFKGFPVGAEPVPVKNVGGRGWSLLRQDLPFPSAVLKESALAHNQAFMRDFTAAHGVLLAPHGKTTMAPQLFARQIEAGAWGITVATVHQLAICVRFGLRRIIMANQLIGRRDVESVIELLNKHPDLEFHFLLDSTAQLGIIEAMAEQEKLRRHVSALLEIGYAGGRTGCRSHGDAMTLARTVARTRHVRLSGVECYEGLLVKARTAEEIAGVRSLTRAVKAAAIACDREQLFADGPIILSAGGSAAFDIVAEELSAALSRPVVPILRSGCYVTHDSGFYQRMLEAMRARNPGAGIPAAAFMPALEVWSSVQSRPEPARAILTMGKRDVSYDLDLPRPTAWFRPGLHALPVGITEWRITGLNDQHAYLELPPGADLAVGDLIGCGISHPCTTFDKWQILWLVDDRYEVCSAIRTFF